MCISLLPFYLQNKFFCFVVQCDCSYFLLYLFLIVFDLSGSAYFEWKAHNGKVYDVQFGSADEEKIYSLGEDKMFYLWAASTTSAPVTEINLNNCQQHPRQFTGKEQHEGGLISIPQPDAVQNKLFGFCFANKYLYILNSSVKRMVVYKVKECNLY